MRNKGDNIQVTIVGGHKELLEFHSVGKISGVDHRGNPIETDLNYLNGVGNGGKPLRTLSADGEDDILLGWTPSKVMKSIPLSSIVNVTDL